MSFLPDDYVVPSNSLYINKMEAGDNQFRILDSPILGNMYWNHNSKPVRKPLGESIVLEDIAPNKDGSAGEAKHFWALPVWSYKEKKVMIWEITQKPILNGIKELVADEDWSNPREYDLLVAKKGSGLETKYSVKSKRPSEITEDIAKAWYEVQSHGFDLKELYHSGDPFNPIQRTEKKKVIDEPAMVEEIYDQIPE